MDWVPEEIRLRQTAAQFFRDAFAKFGEAYCFVCQLFPCDSRRRAKADNSGNVFCGRPQAALLSTTEDNG